MLEVDAKHGARQKTHPMPSMSRGSFSAHPSKVALVLRAALLMLPLFVLFSPEKAHAYTWMIKHGYGRCTVCHADPSGGELLTRYGRVQSDLLLRMRYSKDSVSAEGSKGGGGKSFDSFDSFDSDSGGKKPEGAAGKGKEAGKEGDTAASAESDDEDASKAP